MQYGVYFLHKNTGTKFEYFFVIGLKIFYFFQKRFLKFIRFNLFIVFAFKNKKSTR